MKKLSMKINTEGKTIKEAIADFMKFCKVKGLAEPTIIYYTKVLEVFVGYVGEDAPIKSIDRDVVDSFILKQKETTSNGTLNNYLRGIRALLYFGMERGYCQQFKVRLVRQDEVVKATYTDEELKLLLQKPDLKSCTFSEYRNWVMVNFFLGTGVRVGTLIAIKINDIDLTTSVFTTRHTKNHKQQVIPISRSLNRILMEYLTYRNHYSDDDYLFCDQYGKMFVPKACTRAIRRYGLECGVANPGCHKFRHTFSKNWVLAGGDIFRLQKILGHSTMEMVRKYVNVYGTELQKDFEKFSVLDRLTENKQPIKMAKSSQKSTPK